MHDIIMLRLEKEFIVREIYSLFVQKYFQIFYL